MLLAMSGSARMLSSDMPRTIAPVPCAAEETSTCPSISGIAARTPGTRAMRLAIAS